MAAVTLAIAAFILLRRDCPDMHRPIKLHRAWIGIAGLLVVLNVFVLGVGMLSPGSLGYGGVAETMTGVGILLIALLLFMFRQRIQERTAITWQIHDPEPAMHETTPAPALD